MRVRVFKLVQVVDLFQQLYNNNSGSNVDIRGPYCRSYFHKENQKTKELK